jgi:hypothetical protein
MLSLYLLRDDVDALLSVHEIVHDDAVRGGEQGVVLTGRNVQTGFDLCTALADKDIARQYELTSIALNAKALGI